MSLGNTRVNKTREIETTRFTTGRQVVRRKMERIGMIELPKGVAEGHDSVGDELQLILEHHVLFRQALFHRARSLVLLIVRCYGCVRVSTFKVVFPEF